MTKINVSSPTAAPMEASRLQDRTSHRVTTAAPGPSGRARRATSGPPDAELHEFARPHQMPEILVVPPDSPKQTANLTEACRAEGYELAGIWWNLTPTHYYKTDQGIVCHAVVPQYNLHGNYYIESSRTASYYTTPSNCANESVPCVMYMYHGSLGFYSLYETVVGTYCVKNKVAYVAVQVLGMYDINGVFLAEDMESIATRSSYWYASLERCGWRIER